MTTHTQQTNPRRWVLPFLAAMIAALAAILVGNLSSASAAGVAETRVGASSVVVEPLVGPPEHIAAGQRLGAAGNQSRIVVATGVAAKAEVGGGGQVFTHYTDADGVAGITGAGPLNVGDSVGVGSLKFGQGGNNFLARAPGDNFVTDLGLDATPRQLEGIGVFGARQQYAIQFSHEAALNSGVRPVMVRDNIFTIPGGSCITGACTVTRVR